MLYLATGRVGRDGGNILDAADGHASAGKGAESALGTRAGGLGASTASSTEFDVESVDADLAAAGSNVLSGQHGGVGRRLVTVCLDLHAAGDARDRLLARQIGDVHKSVVERRKNVRNAEVALAIGKLGAELDGLLLLNAGLLGRLEVHPIVSDAIQPINLAQRAPECMEAAHNGRMNVPCWYS